MMGGKSVTVKTSDKKIPVTVMFAALEDGRKLSPFMILNHITVPKEQLLQKSLSDAKLKAK
jgi:hypothetical protein